LIAREFTFSVQNLLMVSSTLHAFSCVCTNLTCVVMDNIYDGVVQHDSLEHLALMEKCVGRFPSWMTRESPVREAYFDRCVLCRTMHFLYIYIYIYIYI
jgi:hypothetical protein